MPVEHLATATELRAGADPETYASAYRNAWDARQGAKGAQQTFELSKEVNFSKIRVRRVTEDRDVEAWRLLLHEYHYIPHSSSSVKSYGRFLRYVAEAEGVWLGLIAWSGSFLSLGDRDAWIGWDKETRIKRNRNIAQNLVFCLLPTAKGKNLASAILAKAERAVKADWETVYKDKLALVDTLVSEDLYKGTCYKAANWSLVGKTKGMGYKAFRKDVKGYGAENIGKLAFNHGIKKLIFVHPLDRNWKQILGVQNARV